MSDQNRKNTPKDSHKGRHKEVPQSKVQPSKQGGSIGKNDTQTLERIAKVMARAGVASRRESERLIEARRVSVNGKKIESPALNVSPIDIILVNGRPLPDREVTQVWRFHKPRGCVTTHKDPEGRELAFDHLPEDMARVMSIGRLDYNTEGLLLLTNDGGLSRYLELPATGWLRRYRVRVRGSITQHKLDELKDGITVDGVRYGRIDAQLNRQDKANLWITVSIREGKNREIRRIFESLGMAVSRLIRISYGPFMLGDLGSGQVEAIKPKILIEQLGEDVAAKLGIPLDAVDPAKSRRGFKKDGLDDAIKSKKPGSPKGGKSLNFGNGKRKFTDRNGKHGEEGEKRAKTGRRSRNSSRSLEERHKSRDESKALRKRDKRRSENTKGNRHDRRNNNPKLRNTERRSSPNEGRRGQRRSEGSQQGHEHNERNDNARSSAKRLSRPVRNKQASPSKSGSRSRARPSSKNRPR